MRPAEFGLVVAWLGCVLGAAALSTAEVAIIRVRRSRVVVDVERGDGRSRQLLELIDDLPIVLNTVLLLALLLQVTTATIGGYLTQTWFGNVGVTVGTVLTTALLFLYAEAIPKTMALRSPHRMARLATPAISAAVAVARPLVAGLLWLAERQTPGSRASATAVSEEELRALARESAEAGVIEPDDAELVDRSFEFGDRMVEDVMVDRDDITFVGADQRLGEALAVAVASGHRRLPICGSGLDDVLGIARLRDVVASARDRAETPVVDVASPVLRCDRSWPIARLLDVMQATGRHLAIVADGGGRTLGLVTIEDVVAELVGEIADPDPGDN